MIKLFLAVILFLTPPKPLWLYDLNKAEETAKKENKLILLSFSGSDWCIPCIKMKEEIFSNDAFSDYATTKLILVNADFPRKKKNQLTKEQQVINDKLAEKYNPNGSFPYTVLLDKDGNKLKTWDGYYKNGIEKFITEIREISIY